MFLFGWAISILALMAFYMINQCKYICVKVC